MTRCLGCAVVRHGFTHPRVARSPTLAWGRLSHFLALPSSNSVQLHFHARRCAGVSTPSRWILRYRTTVMVYLTRRSADAARRRACTACHSGYGHRSTVRMIQLAKPCRAALVLYTVRTVRTRCTTHNAHAAHSVWPWPFRRPPIGLRDYAGSLSQFQATLQGSSHWHAPQ